MNVYDFDGTIYDGDSTIDFYLYCIKHFPRILKKLPIQFKGFVLYLLKKIEKTQFKEYFYSFLQELDNTDIIIKDFWNLKSKKIKKWYLSQKQNDDVIISASPNFLLYPICETLEIKHLIASNVNIHTGKYDGNNCRGAEKVIRLNKEMPNAIIENFYSDSESDVPLAKIAKHSYIVKKDKILEWRNI